METLSVVLFAVLTICSTTMADDAALREVADAGNQFANHFGKVLCQFTFLKKFQEQFPWRWFDNAKDGQTVVDGQNTNLIYSPLSAQVVLAMAAYGAGGTTAAEMRSVLRLPSDNSRGLDGYESLIKLLNSITNVELRLANKIYVGEGFAVKPAFAALTTNKFLSTSESVNFAESALAASTINAWCAAQTNNRIKDVITPDSIDGDTKLVLLNAVYFKGQWIKKFDAALTQARPFHVDDKTTKDVATMYIKDRFKLGDVPNMPARFIEIPYKGNEMSMVIILPNEVTGLKHVQDNLHNLNLTDMMRSGYHREVELYLPKFKIESTLDLGDILKKMGMGTMFTNDADFSGISDIPLKVSKVIQKAFIEVNEEGSEAAAVTGMILMTRCMIMSESFEIDRPFTYVIVSMKKDSDGAPLNVVPVFTGNVLEPKY